MISFTDLGHEKLPLEGVVELAKQFNRRAGMAFLARLNLYLSLADLSGEPTVRIHVQRELTKRVSSPDRLREMGEAFKNRDLCDRWVLLHRAQLLAGIKLIALYGCDEGGNCLKSDEDQAKIGELALAINSCYGPGLSEPDRPFGDVIAQIAAGVELHNLPLAMHGVVRARTLLGPIMRDYLAGLSPESSPPPFERIVVLLNGINFRDFLDITLYLDGEQRTTLPEVLARGLMTFVDVTAPKRYVSGRSMKAWADLMAVGFENVRALVQHSERDPAFFFDFTLFRRFPLWRADDGRYFCIDGMFVAERLSSFGLYWVVLNGLEDESLRQRFQEAWGELIQEYVLRLIEEFPRNALEVFTRRPRYADDGTEVFDSSIVAAPCLIPVEIKSSVVPIRQEYAGEAGAFFDGVLAKFGGGPSAAVEQLLRNIGSLFAPVGPRKAHSIPALQIGEVLPVVVVHEPILRFGLAAHVVVKEFMVGLSNLPTRAGLRIHPVQIVEVEELERIEPYLRNRDFTLAECLRAKVVEDPGHRMALWQFVTTRFLPARGIGVKLNARLAATFEWLWQATSWRTYRGDYCDPALEARRHRSGRAYVCARPVGGDELLLDEVVVFSEHANVADAYEAIEQLHAEGYPKQQIVADGFLCGVVDESGFMLDPPLSGTVAEN
jgi:hypothetical protein